MIKSRGAKGKARVTFTVDPRVGARTAAVCGEWNVWVPITLSQPLTWCLPLNGEG